jgi:hypothetical protein
MKLAVRPRPEVADDLAGLPDDELRRIALQLIVSLAEHPYAGQPLRGSISDCRKLYFDRESVEERPAFRVVYRLKPDERDPTEVDIIALGERADLAVYQAARRRLDR